MQLTKPESLLASVATPTLDASTLRKIINQQKRESQITVKKVFRLVLSALVSCLEKQRYQQRLVYL